jgi:hypothetical protein
MNKKEYKKLQKENKLVSISSEIFGDNALAIESILNALIIKNKEKESKKNLDNLNDKYNKKGV